MTVNELRFELLMDAGNGAQKAGDILIKAFAKKGVYVYIEPIIPAEISPPKRTPHSMSGVVIRLSSDEINNIGSYSKLVIVEHEILLKRRLVDKEFDDNVLIFLDDGDQKRAADDYAAAIHSAEERGAVVTVFSISDIAKDIIKELNGNGKNMFYLGMLTKAFNVEAELLESFIRQTFKRLPEDKLKKNLDIFKEGYVSFSDICSDNFEIKAKKRESRDEILLDGNTALSLGIIDAGIKLYAGYPITPASSIMHSLAKLLPAYGGVLHQAEDEISAIGVVIGSYFSGVPAITATSGPGLSLKQEFIGFSVSAEIPCIVIDVQRGGPSTGLPTRTEQSDLFAAIFGSHGDSPKVVISVSSIEDCFYAPHLARYLTEKLRLPVIILSDYLTSVSYKILNKMTLYKLQNSENISDNILQYFKLQRLPDSIQMVKDNQSNPGVEGLMRRVTGLNTSATGSVEYTSESNQRSHDIRNEKLHHVRRALLEPEIIGEPEGDLLMVGWGSSRGVLEESVKNMKGLGVSAMHLKIVYPLPLHLKETFSRFKKVVTVEMAYADSFKETPFAILLRNQTLIDIQCLVAGASGRPLKPSHVIKKVKDCLNGVIA